MSSRARVIRDSLRLAGIQNQALETALLDDCLWLDGSEGINEDLGSDLLGSLFEANGLELVKSEEFVIAYNATLRRRMPAESQILERDRIFQELSALLSQFGVVGVVAGCDYWLVEDSFSTDSIVVISYSGLNLLGAARPQLQSILDGQCVFRCIEVQDDDGKTLALIERR